MGGPVGRADLLGDQPVAGAFVRRAQQGLGQAHQGQAFPGAEGKFLQEAFHHPLAAGGLARGQDQGFGLGPHRNALGRIQWRGGDQVGDDLGLATIFAGVQPVPVHGALHRFHFIGVFQI